MVHTNTSFSEMSVLALFNTRMGFSWLLFLMYLDNNQVSFSPALILLKCRTSVDTDFCHFWLLDWMTSDYFHSPLLLMSLCGTMARRSIYKHQIHTTFISCSNISRAIMLGIWMNMLYPYKMRMIASVSYSYHKYWFVSVCLSLSYLPIHLSNHPSIPPSNVLLNTS